MMAVSLQAGGLNVVSATEIVLVRHGEAERGLSRADRGDPWLSQRGREQATRVAETLAAEEVTAVYSSHLRRAAETAEPLAAVLGVAPIVLEGLAEFDCRGAEYLFFEDLRRDKDPRYFACMEGDLTPWGTTYPEFRDGALAALSEIVAAHSGGRVVVFTHGGVLNVALGHVLGLDRMWFFLPDNGGFSRVAVNRDGRMRVVTINERAHLRDLRTEPRPVPDVVPASATTPAPDPTRC